MKGEKKKKKTDKKHFGTNVTNKYIFFQAKAVFQQYIWQNLEYKKEAG